MDAPIEKLYKFLKLEVERGYDDKAVVGGLQNILESWENEARAFELSNIIIQAVTARLRDYHQLTPASREEILRGLWKRVKRSTKGPVPDLFEDTSAALVERKPEQPQAPIEKPIKAVSDTEEIIQEESAPVEAEQEPVERPADKPEDQDESSRKPDKQKRKSARKKYIIPPVLSADEAAALKSPLTVISGIGNKIAERLETLNINTLGDALYYFPRRYDDYSRMVPINRLMYGQTVTIIGNVERAMMRPTRAGRKVVEALISDGTGAIRLTWFNQPWLVDQLKKAGSVSISGKIDQYLGRLVMNSPDWEPVDAESLHTNRIVPVYPLTGKISQKWLRGKIKEVVDYWADKVQEPLPEKMLRKAKLMPISMALKQIHYPDSWEDLEAAQNRLAFDEIFTLQLGVIRQRRLWKKRVGTRFEVTDDWLANQYQSLPYELTSAQKTAIQDIRSDLASGQPMNRLLQGDVGAGKTVVAALGIGMVSHHGGQAALMAPTSILAEQHFQGLAHLLSSEDNLMTPDQIVLLVGATPESEKQRIRERLASGEIKLVIGTHALLEPDVKFQNLAMVVIDEQHRFGVKQRAILREKGNNPHLLVMTATPIPRSLALTVYGDLDLSVMNEMPPGRQKVDTFLLRPVERERAYTLIKREVNVGRQAFMIFPLVEESEKSEAKAAVEEFERLQKNVFPKIKLGLLHGRLGAADKEAVMTSFRDREIQILVSTSVVEVGVDIPNATVMVIEGANRFGLAQLHQFRGRVGRGQDKSYCVLVPDKDQAEENDRLRAMVETNDGFILAEKDLDQRGPGQFLGTEQSGYSGLKLANITDVELIEKSRRLAKSLYKEDPDLSQPEHAKLAEQVQQIWGHVDADMS